MKKLLLGSIFALLFFAKIQTLHAYDVERVKSEIFVQLAQGLKGNPKNAPLLILIGGYPGAGKMKKKVD